MSTKPSFIGLDTEYPTADGQLLTRLHLDGAASPLASTIAIKTIQAMLPHYSNTHSYVHTSAQISTKALAWAHQQVLSVLGANSEEYTAVFSGAGTTAGINRLVRGLSAARPKRKIVLVSAMEHHANDLPHRQFDNQVEYIPLKGDGSNQGAIDTAALQRLLEKHKGQVNYIAFSAISNVTGIINPVVEITRLAHQYDALVLVDAAQSVAHQATTISDHDPLNEIDFLVFSGHKLYTPMAPGVIIAKKAILTAMQGQDLGGGSVENVSYYDFQLLNDYPDREQSGTPNIVGAVALAKVMQALQNYGFDKIHQHNRRLLGQLQKSLKALPKITVYGDQNAERLGALAFNHHDIDHGLLAAILNDYYSIAVRNECFCAHPYVSSMIKEELWELDLSDIPEERQQAFINRKRGMVRASISLYNNAQDIDRLLSALHDIEQKIDEYRPLYKALEDGSYQHLTFSVDWQKQLDIELP